MGKAILSVIITLFLGPGTGHLYLRQFRKGFIFILVSLLCALLLALQVASSLSGRDITTLSASQILQEFNSGHPRMVFFFDVLFAALWAYAIVDVYRTSRRLFPTLPPPDERSPL